MSYFSHCGCAVQTQLCALGSSVFAFPFATVNIFQTGLHCSLCARESDTDGELGRRTRFIDKSTQRHFFILF